MNIKEKNRQNKGITLIALVITIIVMLILVAVTISMAVNGGLFNFAGKASKDTQNAINKEGELAGGRIEIDGVVYNSIDEYLNGGFRITSEIREENGETYIYLTFSVVGVETGIEYMFKYIDNNFYSGKEESELEEMVENISEGTNNPISFTDEVRAQIQAEAADLGVSYKIYLKVGLLSYDENKIQQIQNAIKISVTVSNGDTFESQIGETYSYKVTAKKTYTFNAVTGDGKRAEHTVNMSEEKFSEIYGENTTITQGEYTATIPKGFAVGTSKKINKIENGLVIQDADGNEFVWIPVEKAIITADEIATLKTEYNVTTDTEAIKALANDKGIFPMAVEVVEEENGSEVTNYKGILYEFEGTTTLKAKKVYDWTDTTGWPKEPAICFFDEEKDENIWTETLYQESYNAMIKSVRENGGFYVGRYEISEGLYEDGTKYAQSQAGLAAVCDVWWNLYIYEKNYAEYNSNLGVTSEMIWGSQWDQMMIFVNGKDDGRTTPEPFYVTVDGNRRAGVYILTGGNSVDQVANIFDLEARYPEWTQEVCGDDLRTNGSKRSRICEVICCQFKRHLC